MESKIEQIDLPNDSIDTVICTHTLEHIREAQQSIDNMVRICRKRLIIVMPCQRNYKYTPDLHVHFLPYISNFKSFVNLSTAQYFKLGGDFVCVYDK